MATITRFEDIQAWQQARELCNRIYSLTRSPSFRRDMSLAGEMRRTAVSIMANIAEGFARRTDREFVNFLSISHGSTAELQSHLYVALDQSYIAEEQFGNVYRLCDVTSKLTQGLSTYLQKKDKSS